MTRVLAYAALGAMMCVLGFALCYAMAHIAALSNLPPAVGVAAGVGIIYLVYGIRMRHHQ